MARYYFHVRDSDGLLDDPEGAEFPDLDAAQADAVVAAREVLAERIKAGRPVEGLQFEIADDAGQLLATVPMRPV